MLYLVPKANYSGQFWKIEEPTQNTGNFLISTIFRGVNTEIDILDDAKFQNVPILIKKGNYCGLEKTNKRIMTESLFI